MFKVKIVFPSLFQLWDFKQIFPKRVLETRCRKHSLICICTEEEIELAIHAYRATVEPAVDDPKNQNVGPSHKPASLRNGLESLSYYLFRF